MRRVRRRSFFGRVSRGERGAVGTILAVLLLGGVVMGMLALSVDVGNIWSERRQLQNGADAASLALADACAQNASAAGCSTDPTANGLQSLAGDNAIDKLAGLDPANGQGKICFRGTSSITLPSPLCVDPGSYQQLTKCPPLPSWLTADFPYVETSPVTKSAGANSTILPKYFSQLLAGGGPDVAETACARAAWGQPASYSGSVPLVMSECEWSGFVKSTSFVYPAPPEGSVPGYGGAGEPPWPAQSFEHVIYFANSDKAAPCTYSNGKDGPGGFGDVQVSGNNCAATVSTNSWLVGDNGKSVSVDCKPAIAAMRGKVVAVPVFDCLFIDNSTYTGLVAGAGSCDGSGSGGTYNYHIAGWAAFYLSGYVFPSAQAPSYLTGLPPCSSSESCISGWFVKASLDANSIVAPGGANDYGTYAVVPAG